MNQDLFYQGTDQPPSDGEKPEEAEEQETKEKKKKKNKRGKRKKKNKDGESEFEGSELPQNQSISIDGNMQSM